MAGLAARKIKPAPEADPRFSVRRLVPDEDHGLWLYVPMVCDRIRAFCSRYDPDTDPNILCAELQHKFVGLPNEYQDPMTAIIAIRNYRLVGHMLARVEKWSNRPVGTILQVEIDPGARVPRHLLRGALTEIEAWASRHGAQRMLVDAVSPEAERIFRTFWGFERYRIRMKKEL